MSNWFTRAFGSVDTSKPFVLELPPGYQAKYEVQEILGVGPMNAVVKIRVWDSKYELTSERHYVAVNSLFMKDVFRHAYVMAHKHRNKRSKMSEVGIEVGSTGEIFASMSFGPDSEEMAIYREAIHSVQE